MRGERARIAVAGRLVRSAEDGQIVGPEASIFAGKGEHLGLPGGAETATRLEGGQAMTARTAGHRATEQHQFFSRKVLLVDEDYGDLRHYAEILEQQGYEVRMCASYDEGAQCLDCEPFDFVVVSQGSRAFEGRALVERVVMVDRHIPVLVLARCADMNCYLEAMQLGAVDYLEKPLTPSELARVVETHLRPRQMAA